MVCNWSVFHQKISIFGLAQTKFNLANIQIDFSVFTVYCVDLGMIGKLG